MAYTVLIFTKLTNAQWHYLAIFFIDFHPDWSRNRESIGINSFMPVGKIVPIQNFMKNREVMLSLIVAYRQTDMVCTYSIHFASWRSPIHIQWVLLWQGVTSKSSSSEVEIIRYQVLIPVTEVQVRASSAKDMEFHFLWELIHLRSQLQRRSEKVYVLSNRWVLVLSFHALTLFLKHPFLSADSHGVYLTTKSKKFYKST
jgi:hypothetical protein